MILSLDVQIMEEPHGVMQAICSAGGVCEIVVHAQRDHVPSPIVRIGRRGVRISSERCFDDPGRGIPRLEDQVAVPHPVPLGKVLVE